ncbi:arsenate reductase/protein-tyrosine-phosphatase family protein [Nocardia sp. NPDC004722]
MDQGLEGALGRLVGEFGGELGADVVEGLLSSSYAQLAGTVGVPGDVAGVAERFARDRLIALSKAAGRRGEIPAVLFVCTHNAGRSQMALGFFARLAGDRAVGWSGGSSPGSAINPVVVQAMAERGIDIAAEFPKPWTDELVWAADVVVDMGCGDSDPIVSGHRFEQWWLADPAGRGLEDVREIRDQVEMRVRRLVADLGLAG